MNKRTKKRAVLVYIAVCLFYGTVAFKVPEKITMRRVSLPISNAAQDMSIFGGRVEPASHTVRSEKILPQPEKNLPLPLPPKDHAPASAKDDAPASAKDHAPAPAIRISAERGTTAAGDASFVEPSLLIVVPLICHALDRGWIEADGLIFSKKDDYSKGGWKRPIDIIRDKDESGIRSILNTIGKNHVVEFLKREGLESREGLTVEDLMLGRGYVLEKKKLTSLYDRFVSEQYKDLFPISFSKAGIKMGKEGFELIAVEDGNKGHSAEAEREWMMPNLAGLPLRLAIEKLSKNTTKIRVYGSGTVAEQSPRSFERLRGEVECSIQGRVGRE